VVDVSRVDRDRGEDRAGSHGRHDEEHRRQPEQVAEGAAEQGGGDIAGVIERFIAPELVRKARLLHQSECQSCNGGAHRRTGHAVDGLSGRDFRQCRHEEDERRGRDDGERRRNHERALCFRRIDERTERRGRGHAGIAADRHHQADLRR
jgi:hypothetical protein